MTNTDICLFPEKIFKNRNKAIFCDLCISHLDSNDSQVSNGFISNHNLNYLGYGYLKSNDETWYCKTFIQEILPFCNK